MIQSYTAFLFHLTNDLNSTFYTTCSEFVSLYILHSEWHKCHPRSWRIIYATLKYYADNIILPWSQWTTFYAWIAFYTHPYGIPDSVWAQKHNIWFQWNHWMKHASQRIRDPSKDNIDVWEPDRIPWQSSGPILARWPTWMRKRARGRYSYLETGSVENSPQSKREEMIDSRHRGADHCIFIRRREWPGSLGHAGCPVRRLEWCCPVIVYWIRHVHKNDSQTIWQALISIFRNQTKGSRKWLEVLW
jgi:hypothetical protein